MPAARAPAEFRETRRSERGAVRLQRVSCAPHLGGVGPVEGLELGGRLVQERVDQVGDELVSSDLAQRVEGALVELAHEDPGNSCIQGRM